MRGFSNTIKQAFSQMFRNLNMSTASIFAITAMMLILGLFFTLMVNINLMSQNAEAQFDTIPVYLLENVSQEEGRKLAEKFKDINHVADAVYYTKEDSFAEMKERWGENGYLLDGLPDNPFPATIEVTAEDIEFESYIVQKLEQYEGVEQVKLHQDAINKLITITNYIQTGALILIAILIIVSIIVVSNTIKITVHAREREINIMKYIGATNWFIRGPFLVEGMIIGLIASVLGAAIVGFGYYQFVEIFTPRFLILFNSGLVPFDFIFENLVIMFVALGIGIGSLGSIMSMRRFLDT